MSARGRRQIVTRCSQARSGLKVRLRAMRADAHRRTLASCARPQHRETPNRFAATVAHGSSRIGFKNVTRFDAVAVGIADEGGVIARGMLPVAARLRRRNAAGRERRGMEASTSSRAGAPVSRHGRRYRPAIGTMAARRLIQNSGYVLPKPTVCGSNLELREAERRQHGLIEARRPVEIAHADGHVIDHCSGVRCTGRSPMRRDQPRRAAVTPARRPARACRRSNPSAPGTRRR